MVFISPLKLSEDKRMEPEGVENNRMKETIAMEAENKPELLIICLHGFSGLGLCLSL